MTKRRRVFQAESCAERVQGLHRGWIFANSSAVPRYRGDFFRKRGQYGAGVRNVRTSWFLRKVWRKSREEWRNA